VGADLRILCKHAVVELQNASIELKTKPEKIVVNIIMGLHRVGWASYMALSLLEVLAH
jgi:hypothetical protein